MGVEDADGLLVQAPGLSSWTEIGTARVRLSLKKGGNTLRFYSVDSTQGQGDSEYGPDIDLSLIHIYSVAMLQVKSYILRN